MDVNRKSCRICLLESEFNVSILGSYCQRTNMIDKILVCLKLVIEETDSLNTICYKCAGNIEKYYDFIMFVKKSQMMLAEPRQSEASIVRRYHVTSHTRQQVFDADCTFSFLEPDLEEKKEPKPSSPFFSYFSQPKVMKTVSNIWKTPKDVEKRESKRDEKFLRPSKGRARHHSRDLFDSQSQDVEEHEPKSVDWKLTPDDNILKRVRDKCFGRSNF